ncbi:MAG TPA: S1 RNA-binding domain-containing protein, partial [Aggregatilineales bacterium]|nr:S1 RNA-binding domain-containing protein [Aggregatilineales bacterium]
MTTETPSELAEEQVENTLEAVDSAPASEQSIRSIEDIAPKQKLKGKVKRVELQGAIIDLGLATDGLLHISQLRAEPVKNVTDVVKQGDEIVVYVLAADARAPRIDLTMIEPPAVTWQEIKVNQVYEGKVERIEKY